MKKIKVDTVIELEDRNTTVGEELRLMLNNLPCQDAKTAAKQIDMAKDLKKVMELSGEWFSYEEDNEPALKELIDVAAKRFSPRLVAPIYNAIQKAVAYKADQPQDTAKDPETPVGKVEKPA